MIDYCIESADGLQAQLNILKEFCDHRGVEVNIAETECMTFRGSKGHVCDPVFRFGDSIIKCSDSFRYLGVVFASTKPVSAAVPPLVSAGKGALFASNNRCESMGISNPGFRIDLFDILVRPVLSYGAEFGLPFVGRSHCETLDSVHRMWLKMSLQVS